MQQQALTYLRIRDVERNIRRSRIWEPGPCNAISGTHVSENLGPVKGSQAHGEWYEAQDDGDAVDGGGGGAAPRVFRGTARQNSRLDVHTHQHLSVTVVVVEHDLQEGVFQTTG